MTISSVIFSVIFWLVVLTSMNPSLYKTLWNGLFISLPPADIEEDTANMTKDFSLDAAKLRELSTWQLCNIHTDIWWPRRVIHPVRWLNPMCTDYDPTTSYGRCLKILARIPETHAVFDIYDEVAPISTKVARHRRLARFTAVELESRFNITTLPNNGKICVDMHRFNGTVANLLPWYDLLTDWDRGLDHMLSSRKSVLKAQMDHLKHIQSRIRHLIGCFRQIFKMMDGEDPRQPPTEYQETRCSKSKTYNELPTKYQDPERSDSKTHNELPTEYQDTGLSESETHNAGTPPSQDARSQTRLVSWKEVVPIFVLGLALHWIFP
ncbi:hypothetical protein F5Y10DRAFT_264524 [Nemania abortiva]|nr:hypothetical protein F5Y10DRAFT_264524 [Nemania abortiva]